MNRLEQFISYISPRLAAERAAYRAATRALTTYQGGVSTRLDTTYSTTTYNMIGGSPTARAELKKMRDRARNLDNNNAIAAGILDRATENVIGTGIMIRPATDSPEFNDEVAKAWKEWTRTCDARGMFSFEQLQAMAYRCHLRDGDSGVVLVSAGGDSKLQVLEGDKVCTPSNATKYKGSTVIDGVTVNAIGRPQGYWLEVIAADSNSTASKIDYTYVDARDFVFLPRLTSPSQVRGVTAFAQGFTLFDQITGYVEASVVAARIAACQALMIKRNNSSQLLSNLQSRTSPAAGQITKLTSIEPGMVHYLGPDEEVQTVNPSHPTQSFEGFVTALGRLLGLNFGLTIEQVFLDFSRANYSSSRAARLQAQQTALQQQDWFASVFVSRVYQWWLSREIKRGTLPNAPAENAWAHEWIPQGRPWVDPTKEIDAAIKAVALGVDARAYIASERGFVFRDLCRQNSEDEDTLEEFGLSTTLPGQPSPTSQPQGQSNASQSQAVSDDDGSDPADDAGQEGGKPDPAAGE